MRPRHLLASTCFAIAAVTACGAATTPAGPVATTYRANLVGSSEVPPVTTTATGTATFVLNGTTATYTINSTAFASELRQGHIHIGASGLNGPVIVPFTIAAQTGNVASGTINFAQPSFTNGNVTISGDSLKKLFDSGTAYVNLHTAMFGGGEVRGQILKQ